MSSRSYAGSNPNFTFMALNFTPTITLFAQFPHIHTTILGEFLSGCKKERMTEISNLAMTHPYFKRRKKVQEAKDHRPGQKKKSAFSNL